MVRQSHIALADLEPPPLVLGWQASTLPGAFNCSLKLLPTRPVGTNFLTPPLDSLATHGHWGTGLLECPGLALCLASLSAPGQLSCH